MPPWIRTQHERNKTPDPRRKLCMCLYECHLRKDKEERPLILCEVQPSSSLWYWSPEKQQEHYQSRARNKNKDSDLHYEKAVTVSNLQKELDYENEDGFEFVFMDIGKSRSFADSERTKAYRERYLRTKQSNSLLPKTPPHHWDEDLRLYVDASELLHARGAYAQHYQVYQHEVLGEENKSSTVTLTGAAVFRNWDQANESRFQTDPAYRQWIVETVDAELVYYVKLCREGMTRQDLYHQLIELPRTRSPS